MAKRATASPADKRREPEQRRWTVEFTPEARSWFAGLDRESKMRVTAALRLVHRVGPTLGRPTVDSINGSRHHNMKELRVVRRNLRALFVFDPRQRAVMLTGGEKTGNPKGWYKTNIARAEQIYDRHLRRIGEEGRCRPGSRPAGRTSSDKSR